QDECGRQGQVHHRPWQRGLRRAALHRKSVTLTGGTPMAVATLADFKIYNPQVQSAIRERLTINLDAFNGASNNVLRMLTEAKRGELEKTAFFQKLSDGAVARRNPSVTTGVDDTKFEQGEIVEIKVNRRI